MRRLNSTDSDFPQAFQSLVKRQRHQATDADVRRQVQQILEAVAEGGDTALLTYTERFDGHRPASLRFDKQTLQETAAQCPSEVRDALALAAERIRAFHDLQPLPAVAAEDAVGVRYGLRWQPIESAGLYVPGGKASYPSSVLMNAIPAKVAGVERLVMVTPTPHGHLNPAVFAAAEVAGVDEIYCIGGAQAVAALAYGTETIAPVDKIVGPGNAYVAEAKRQVFGLVGIDSIAGPSEILVLAEAGQNPDWLAWDLLSQAEHGPDSESILITDCLNLADQVAVAVTEKLAQLSDPKAETSWQDNGVIIVVPDLLKDGIALSNQLAPEHLELCVNDPQAYWPHITHAGSVFMGSHTPEAIGDYLGGPNHVLPTSRTARFASGLSVYDFSKRTTYLECTKAALEQLGPAAITLAQAEGLPAHGHSVQQRLES